MNATFLIIIYILIALLTLSALILGVTLWLLSSMMMYPSMIPFNEKWNIYQNPAEIGLAYENVSFKSKDGTLLKGWYIQHYNNAPAIIFVHGRGYSRMNGLDYSNSLYEAGFNLLLFDLRNAGESKTKNSFTSMGFYEQEDVIAAVEYLNKEYKIEKFGVFGFSMGAASSILAMSKEVRIKAGVFEGSYTSCRDIFSHRSKIDVMPFLVRFLEPALKLFTIRTKAIIEEISPIATISKISPRAIFLIHGKEDKTVPFKHALKLFAKAKEPRQIWKTNTGHISTWYKYRDEAENRVKDFFEKWLSEKESDTTS